MVQDPRRNIAPIDPAKLKATRHLIQALIDSNERELARLPEKNNEDTPWAEDIRAKLIWQIEHFREELEKLDAPQAPPPGRREATEL